MGLRIKGIRVHIGESHTRSFIDKFAHTRPVYLPLLHVVEATDNLVTPTPPSQRWPSAPYSEFGFLSFPILINWQPIIDTIAHELEQPYTPSIIHANRIRAELLVVPVVIANEESVFIQTSNARSDRPLCLS
ncbi:hypothetical protein BKA56DRAFT_86683 [Ilyonectria sp. MPI-CAGE-AT-0026]|nr:hypothetical protein BKA56DRAFT_86683 [Ilyonectria sp. MPI-CAGE-AT-0026]